MQSFTVTFNRQQLADILSKMVKNLKPKPTETVIRRMVLIKPTEDGGMVVILATNEKQTYLFRNIAYQTDSGELYPIAVDLIKLSKFVSCSGGETVSFRADSDKDKLSLKAGNTKADLAYLPGTDYIERLGQDETAFMPRGAAVGEISDLPSFVKTLQIMSRCTDDDPLKSFLDGIYTDGEGNFMATDLLRGMLVPMEDHRWKIRTVVPNDLVNMLGDLSADRVLIFWDQDEIWFSDLEGNVIISGFCREIEKFPQAELQKVFQEADKATIGIVLDAAELKTVLDRIRTFFSDNVLCTLAFGDKLKLVGVGNNKDRMQDVISYSLSDGEIPEEMSFQLYLSALELITSVYEGEFKLDIVSLHKSIHCESSSLGIKMFVVPYIRMES